MSTHGECFRVGRLVNSAVAFEPHNDWHYNSYWHLVTNHANPESLILENWWVAFFDSGPIF